MKKGIQIIGEDLMEVTVADSGDARAVAAALRGTGKFEEVVPALGVVTVRFDPLAVEVSAAEDLVQNLADVGRARLTERPTQLVIPVHYGGEFGPDLELVAQSAGLTTEEFITLHTSCDYPVEMIGFTPGFAYLGGLDDKIMAGRLASPRSRVAAGSVGVIRGFTGIYPLAGPGGWPLVGQTDLSLFDAKQARPFTLELGMTVRFEAV